MVIKISNDTSTLNGALIELGETMASNITSKGVTASASDGLTTLAGKILNIAEDDIITITASRPYLLSGEKTDLIVRLADGLGQPLTNKSVSISDGTSVYSGITNNLGIFTLFNVGISATTTFTATYQSVSATCKVILATKRDYGTSSNHNDIWTLRSAESTSLVRGDTYSTVSEIDSNEAYVETDFSDNVTIELDVSINGDVTKFFTQFAKSGGNNTGFSLYNSLRTATINTWYHCKFVINGNSITFTLMVEGATESTKTLESPIKFRLRTFNEITAIRFKNFVIY